MSGFSGAVEGGVLHGYDVVDNLTSTSTTAPLSANMGKTLNEAIAQSTAPDTDVVLPWGNYKDAGTTYALSKSILTAHHIDVLAGYSNAGTNSGYSLAMIPKNLISAGNIFTIVYFTGNDIQHASFEIVDGTHIKIIACSETYLGIREIRAKYY